MASNTQAALNTIQMPATWEEYKRELPVGIPQATGKSFLYGFAFGAVLFSPTLGLVQGVMSAAACVIDAALRPILNPFFTPKDLEDSPLYYFVNVAVALAVTNLLASIIAPTLFGLIVKVNLFTSVLFSIFLYGLFPPATPLAATPNVYI